MNGSVMNENKTVILKHPTPKKEHHLLLEYPATRFFSPVEEAKKQYSSVKPSFFYSLLSTSVCVGVAFSAAALAIEPSKKYAESRDYPPVLFELSNVLTALLINLYGINCLLDELNRGKSIRFIMILSIILGIVSTLPIFFIQQIEEKDPNFVSMMLAIVITVGSMPLQVLGFLEFCQTLYPHLKNFYWRQVKSEEEAAFLELKARDLFLKQLELGLERYPATNQRHDSWVLLSDDLFIKTIQQYGEEAMSSSKETSAFVKTILIIGGLVGIILAETVNVAFIKATFDSFTPKMNTVFAVILTCCVTFPAAVLSAEFGFNAVYALLQSMLNFSQKCNSQGRSEANSPVIPLSLSAFQTIFCLIVSSCSFAASVQFNDDLFKDTLSSEEMTVLNDFTILGVLLFNNYVLNHVSSHYLISGLAMSPDAEMREKAKFYQLGQAILTEYRKISSAVIFDGVHNKLQLADNFDLSTTVDGWIDVRDTEIFQP